MPLCQEQSTTLGYLQYFFKILYIHWLGAPKCVIVLRALLLSLPICLYFGCLGEIVLTVNYFLLPQKADCTIFSHFRRWQFMRLEQNKMLNWINFIWSKILGCSLLFSFHISFLTTQPFVLRLAWRRKLKKTVTLMAHNRCHLLVSIHVPCGLQLTLECGRNATRQTKALGFTYIDSNSGPSF